MKDKINAYNNSSKQTIHHKGQQYTNIPIIFQKVQQIFPRTNFLPFLAQILSGHYHQILITIMNKPTPIRRDIRFLSPPQRQRFFYCLKFLSILPPQSSTPRNFNVAWKVQNGQRYFKNVVPRNIHDQFIASHQTTCEHGAIYFTYYHRHLLACFEIAMNYAEEVLLAGKEALNGQLYKAYAGDFDRVFARYQEIAKQLKKELSIGANDSLPQLAAHYWNPMDYTTNITIPQQLQPRNPDPMDQLYFSVNGHYAWNFNFATRWFSSPNSTPKLPQNFDTMGFFQSQQASYSPVEKSIVYGNLNPRDTSNDKFFGAELIDQYGMSFIGNTASDINLYKNYKKLHENGNTIDICTLDQDEINTLFGSKVKKLHWLSKAERKLLSAENSIKAYAYNKTLPHFQFAYALYKRSNMFIKDYISTQSVNPQNSMEMSHNTMHNNLQLFMSDSQLSITNPIFFLYHSWIDFQLELKIRSIRTNPAQNKTQYNYTRSFLDTRVKPFSVLDQVNKLVQLKYGEYYIFQWANPLTKFYPQVNQPLKAGDYQLAFKSRNFILNDSAKGIRRSDELNIFYQQQYLPANAKRYSNFKGFSKFNFDYNYQVNSYDSQGKREATIMQDNVVPVPSYIREIYDDYNLDWNENKTTLLGSTGTPVPKLASSQNQCQKEYYLMNSLAKAIRMSIGGYARYPSSIKSTVVPIELKLTQKGAATLNLTSQHTQILKKGIVITDASLLTRGTGAAICPNCKDQKQLFIFVSQKLAEMSTELYCDISRSLAQKVHCLVKNQQKVEVPQLKISQIFSLTTPRQIFSKLQFIQGARQVDFLVKFNGKQCYQNCSISIALHSYSVQQNKLQQIVARKKYTLSDTQFQFPRLIGVQTHNKSHYTYIYRHVQCTIINGEQRAEFSFDITMRYKLITFLINLQERYSEANPEGYLDVEVVDRDYEFKMKHFSIGEEEDME